MEYGKKYRRLRVYFNHRSEFPNVWSIDNGDPEQELNVPAVSFDGSAVSAYTGEKRNSESPVAWFEFQNATCYAFQDGVFITNEELVK